jgi:hypothetical protein
MTRTKISIRVLTPSDLSFFKAHEHLSDQRAFDLSGLFNKFYPGLQGSLDPVIFPMTIIGPRARAAHRLTRMATRSQGTRNWHIKGESIHDPAEEPGRYGKLAENDFAIMAFEGGEQPQAVTLILVSAAEDTELHAAIAARFEFPARHTVRELSATAVLHLRASTLGAYTDNAHPLGALSFHDTIEEVLFDTGAPPPPEDIRQLLLSAHETTQHGEELFGAWLTTTGHTNDGFEWISQTRSRSAYHYEVYAARWLKGAPRVFVGVKTTRASFEQPLHMSVPELYFAARTESYRIARLYDVGGETPRLRILTGVQAVASRIMGKLNALPDGVSAASLRLDPNLFEAELEARFHQ